MSFGFAIIGCGTISHFHATAITSLENAHLVGCYARSAAASQDFAAKHSCTAYSSLSDLLSEPTIDIVTICTPSGAHLEPALFAAKAGKHVVIEKPLEITVERCDKIIAACQQAGVLLSTVFQSRFHEAPRLLKQAIDGGRFGTLVLANAYVKWHRTQAYYDSGAWRGTWQLDGGGALMNQAIHSVDLLRWLMGPVRDVSAFTATLAHVRIEVEDTAIASLRFRNGALGTIEATTAAFPGSLKRIEVYGSTGSAVIEEEEIKLWKFAEELPIDEQILAEHAARNESGGGASDPTAISFKAHAKQFADVVDAIIHGRQPMIDGSEGRKSVEIICAIYESASAGQRIQL